MEEKKNISIVCSKCGKRAGANEMKMDKKTDSLICIQCYIEQNKKKKSFWDFLNVFKRKDVVEDEPEEEMPVMQEPEKTAEEKPKEPEKSIFMCPSCNYKFSRKNEQFSGTCPYCGSRNLEKIETGKDADKLLEY